MDTVLLTSLKYYMDPVLLTSINSYMDPGLLTSLNSYIFTLRLARFALLRIPARSKSNNTNARLKAFSLSLTLDPKFGIHSHKTSGNAQLFRL